MRIWLVLLALLGFFSLPGNAWKYKKIMDDSLQMLEQEDMYYQISRFPSDRQDVYLTVSRYQIEILQINQMNSQSISLGSISTGGATYGGQVNPKNSSQAIIVDYNVVYLLELREVDGSYQFSYKNYHILPESFGYNVFWNEDGQLFGVTGQSAIYMFKLVENHNIEPIVSRKHEITEGQNRHPTGVFINSRHFWIGNSESGIFSYSLTQDSLGNYDISPQVHKVTDLPTENILIQRSLYLSECSDQSSPDVVRGVTTDYVNDRLYAFEYRTNSQEFTIKNQIDNIQSEGFAVLEYSQDQTQIYLCSDQELYILQGECPKGEFEGEQGCEQCSNGCLECRSQSTHCCSCLDPLQLLNSSCSCPENYQLNDAGLCEEICSSFEYRDTFGSCQPCGVSCKSCTNSTKCQECEVDAYFYNGLCTESCPEGTLASTTKNECLDQTNSCDYSMDLIPSQGDEGDCINYREESCGESYTLNVDVSTEYQAIVRCVDVLDENGCAEGFIWDRPSQMLGRSCKKDECAAGFRKNDDGVCGECETRNCGDTVAKSMYVDQAEFNLDIIVEYGKALEEYFYYFRLQQRDDLVVKFERLVMSQDFTVLSIVIEEKRIKLRVNFLRGFNFRENVKVYIPPLKRTVENGGGRRLVGEVITDEHLLIFSGDLDPLIVDSSTGDKSRMMSNWAQALTDYEVFGWESVLHLSQILKVFFNSQIVVASLLIDVKTPEILREMQGMLSAVFLQYIPEYQTFQVEYNQQKVVIFGHLEIDQQYWDHNQGSYLVKFQLNNNFFLINLSTCLWFAVCAFLFLVALILRRKTYWSFALALVVKLFQLNYFLIFVGIMVGLRDIVDRSVADQLNKAAIFVFLITFVFFRVAWRFQETRFFRSLFDREIVFYDSLFDLKSTPRQVRFYHEASIYKKLVIAIVIVVLGGEPLAQICIIMSLQILNTAAVCFLRPYKLNLLNILRILNEISTSMFFIILLIVHFQYESILSLDPLDEEKIQSQKDAYQNSGLAGYVFLILFIITQSLSALVKIYLQISDVRSKLQNSKKTSDDQNQTKQDLINNQTSRNETIQEIELNLQPDKENNEIERFETVQQQAELIKQAFNVYAPQDYQSQVRVPKSKQFI